MDRCAVLLSVELLLVENCRLTVHSPDNDFAIATQLIRGGTDRTALAAVVREVGAPARGYLQNVFVCRIASRSPGRCTPAYSRRTATCKPLSKRFAIIRLPGLRSG